VGLFHHKTIKEKFDLMRLLSQSSQGILIRDLKRTVAKQELDRVVMSLLLM